MWHDFFVQEDVKNVVFIHFGKHVQQEVKEQRSESGMDCVCDIKGGFLIVGEP